MLRRPYATDDIAQNSDYIADNSLAAIDRWIDQFDDQFHILAMQPLMGRARDALAAGIRSFTFGRYVIFCAPIDDGIDVVRVLRSACDVGSAVGQPRQTPPSGSASASEETRALADIAAFLERRCRTPGMRAPPPPVYLLVAAERGSTGHILAHVALPCCSILSLGNL